MVYLRPGITLSMSKYPISFGVKTTIFGDKIAHFADGRVVCAESQTS